MFYFFSKKKFLVDYLEGFTDIHNHILPGIDDGAKTTEESISILKGFQEIGITNFIATPHIMDGYYPNTPNSIHEALGSLKNQLKTENITNFTIEAAAEHMVDPFFESIIDSKQIMPLKKDFILIEMSFLQASINFDEAIQKLKKANLFPILAHPERYSFIHTNFNKYDDYKKQGMYFQLNLLSLSNYYGEAVKKNALKLLDNKLFDFVGSDVHNIRQLNAIKEIKIPLKIAEKLEPLIHNTSYNFG
ncbi:histidinol phosphatase [Cellulophaga sp. F20128]|uniref:tyrosine-protein phosphatase n=1 Tax=Cellulophaga sp. F20128 TaxID=2926413 RepID=UPI001FF30A21|nr:CpsB/CapC family capsule biosynthesis tyrosine phosphatase [Cellulophaga sp. F20128]MCK0158911.1 histidinol phosphatase [Cellulophaga sp. F20128]